METGGPSRALAMLEEEVGAALEALGPLRAERWCEEILEFVGGFAAKGRAA